MNAEVTIKFKIKNICDKKDLVDTKMSFEEMVKYLIKEEGLFGVCEDNFKVINIKEMK